jgi:hypothetical protein
VPWDDVLAILEGGLRESVEICASDGRTGDEAVLDIPGCLAAWRSSSDELFQGLLSRGVSSADNSEGGTEGITRIEGWYEETENL